MKILLTGAFGNLGSLVLEQLLTEGHEVIAFDVENKINKKISRKLKNKQQVHIVWGDIRNKEQIQNLVKEQDAVIHLAAVIAPFSENNPDLAYEINVQGTQHIIDAIQAEKKPPLFIFSSSLSVFGTRPKDGPLCDVNDTIVATDHYSGHKIECEKRIQEMKSPWVICRIAAMVDSRMRHSDPRQAKLAFSCAADNHVEYVHPKDVCTAMVNLLDRPEAHHKIHLLGGGKTCQVTHLQLLQGMMGAIGISITAEDFGDKELYAHWMDTIESQQLLDYQNHTFNDFKQENSAKFKYIRPIVRPLSPLIKKAMKVYLGA